MIKKSEYESCPNPKCKEMIEKQNMEILDHVKHIKGLIDSGARSAKEKLLEHYEYGQVQTYLQIDGIDECGGDGVCIVPDDENDFICWGQTDELRHQQVPVRVQILAGTKKSDAIRLLTKCLEVLISYENETLDMSEDVVLDVVPDGLPF
jgi:hypothetical protein